MGGMEVRCGGEGRLDEGRLEGGGCAGMRLICSHHLLLMSLFNGAKGLINK